MLQKIKSQWIPQTRFLVRIQNIYILYNRRAMAECVPMFLCRCEAIDRSTIWRSFGAGRYETLALQGEKMLAFSEFVESWLKSQILIEHLIKNWYDYCTKWYHSFLTVSQKKRYLYLSNLLSFSRSLMTLGDLKYKWNIKEKLKHSTLRRYLRD